MSRILRLGAIALLVCVLSVLAVAAVQALAPAPAHAQAAGQGLRTGTSVQVATGSKVCLDGTSCSHYVNWSGSQLNLTSDPVVVSGSLTVSGGTLNSVARFQGSAQGTYGLRLLPNVNDNSVAVQVGNGTGLTAGNILELYNDNFTTKKASVDFNGVFATGGLTCAGATHCGTQALTAGSATVTVVSGCHAICTDTTAAAAVKCSVASTTLTITGTSTDSINYFCF